jgi:hypothetical protein
LQHEAPGRATHTPSRTLTGVNGIETEGQPLRGKANHLAQKASAGGLCGRNAAWQWAKKLAMHTRFEV